MRAPKGLEDPQKLGNPGDCRPQQEAEHPWGFGESQELDPHRELSSPRDVGISRSRSWEGPGDWKRHREHHSAGNLGTEHLRGFGDP